MQTTTTAQQPTSPLSIRDGIRWIGVLDPELRVFDVVVRTEWGTTYNSYLVEGQHRKAIIETVKCRFEDPYLESLSQIVDLKTIDYVVLNHTEPDHSGALADFLAQAPNATVVCSKFAQGLLKEIVNADFPCKVVRDGDVIDLGGKTLTFIQAPFLHWPDSMFTNVPEERTLFPGDVFGCHYCNELMFDDLIKADFTEAQEFYFHAIMSPFKNYMLQAIQKIEGIDIDVICPAHGPILRTNPRNYIKQVQNWSSDVNVKNNPKQVFVGYVSAYGNTRKLAEEIARGATEAGLSVTLMDVSEHDLSEAVHHAEKADAIVIGSPTFNRDAVKPVWDCMIALSAPKVKGKVGGAFGSFGWSGEAVEVIENRLRHLGLKLTQPACQTKLVPSEEALRNAYDYGRQIAAQL